MSLGFRDRRFEASLNLGPWFPPFVSCKLMLNPQCFGQEKKLKTLEFSDYTFMDFKLSKDSTLGSNT